LHSIQMELYRAKVSIRMDNLRVYLGLGTKTENSQPSTNTLKDHIHGLSKNGLNLDNPDLNALTNKTYLTGYTQSGTKTTSAKRNHSTKITTDTDYVLNGMKTDKYHL